MIRLGGNLKVRWDGRTNCTWRIWNLHNNFVVPGCSCRPLVGFVGTLCVWWTNCKGWLWIWVLFVCNIHWWHLVIIDHERGRRTYGYNFIVCCACENHWKDRRRGRLINLYWSCYQKGKRFLWDHFGSWSPLSWFYVSGLWSYPWIWECSRHLRTSWENTHG